MKLALHNRPYFMLVSLLFFYIMSEVLRPVMRMLEHEASHFCIKGHGVNVYCDCDLFLCGLIVWNCTLLGTLSSSWSLAWQHCVSGPWPSSELHSILLFDATLLQFLMPKILISCHTSFPHPQSWSYHCHCSFKFGIKYLLNHSGSKPFHLYESNNIWFIK
jgi:hypothetical protein